MTFYCDYLLPLPPLCYCRFTEKGNLEVLLFTIQSKMRANNQKVYMPREGKLISDINKVTIQTPHLPLPVSAAELSPLIRSVGEHMQQPSESRWLCAVNSCIKHTEMVALDTPFGFHMIILFFFFLVREAIFFLTSGGKKFSLIRPKLA